MDTIESKRASNEHTLNNNDLTHTLASSITMFIDQLNKTYDFETDHALKDLWLATLEQGKLIRQTNIMDDDSSEEKISIKDNKEELLKLKRTELVERCKSLHLPCSGKKEVLIERILAGANNTTPIIKKNASSGSRNSKSKKKKMIPILFKLMKNRKSIDIHRNNYGHFEHTETGFIIDEKTHHVVGKQVGGTVVKLNEQDYALCKECGFDFD